MLEILEKNGAPMQLNEIEIELNKIRGLGKTFQLHTTLTTPNIVLVSQGLWGLRSRDINVSKEEELELVSLIKDEFKNGNKILNFKNLKTFKEQIKIDKNVSVYQLMRILLAHIPVGRRRTPEKLIFLHKMNRENPLNFCFYSPDISDNDAKEFLINNSQNEFHDVRDNEDSTNKSRNYEGNRTRLLKTYSIEGKTYIGRDNVAAHYGISTSTVTLRVRLDEYPDWKILDT